VAAFEFKPEKPVYDVVDEESYVQLVAKRRDEGGGWLASKPAYALCPAILCTIMLNTGDFIVDDNGQGYADLGEEDDHWNSKGDREGAQPGTAQATLLPSSLSAPLLSCSILAGHRVPVLVLLSGLGVTPPTLSAAACHSATLPCTPLPLPACRR
jgi:hypothetical protein